MNIKETFKEVLFSILPISIFMIIFQVISGSFNIENLIIFLIGVIITIIGFTLFLVGAENSLIPLGDLVGKSLLKNNKLWFIICFIICVGFAATIAEPGVQILVNQFNLVSGNFIGKYTLAIVISLGVGIYLALSLLKFIYNISIKKILLFSYILIFILAILCPNEYLALAFDSGGVTTGPMTVPFILAFGIGISSIKGTSPETHESFGYVGLASVGPILAVLILGVISRC
mgnify:CR=1 FL=1